MKIIDRAGWAVAAALALALIATAAGIVRGGPLDPDGAPAPTGISLDEMPASWGRTLAANDGAVGPNPPAGCDSSRFDCVFGNEAVLDKETGLVWEREPLVATTDWHLAVRACLGSALGDRMGWRMPSLEELRSLLTATGLPAGDPFGGDGTFWTSTTRSDATTQAYVINTANPLATFSVVKADPNFRRFWCVRGGVAYDAY